MLPPGPGGTVESTPRLSSVAAFRSAHLPGDELVPKRERRLCDKHTNLPHTTAVPVHTDATFRGTWYAPARARDKRGSVTPL